MTHIELNPIPGARRFYWLAAFLLASSTACALLVPGIFWRLTGSSIRAFFSRQILRP
jgi:hypothetical protein